ncbi:MAG: universal stress protein [Reichenbachiella sp.]|uniref:universal stress protein n=1 Tax=Reichenbachiella sp. TaxID=2184521 RepID=UPI00326337D1
MRINKILVPVDFSNCSINALKMAVGIAKTCRASIEVVNAFHMPAYPHADVVAADTIIQPILAEYEEQIQDQFDELQEKVPGLKSVDFTTRKFVSATKDAIYTCVEKDDIGLIVMGTKGSHDSIEKLIGSMSSDVIRFAKVPVLMIPENVESFDVKLIGFAADLNKIEEMNKLEVLAFFAKMTGAQIKIFNISSDTDEQNIIDKARERMALVESLKGIDHSYAWINSSKPLQGILDFVESHKLDMLAMFPRHHGFWDGLLHSSVTKKVAMKIKVPLLTIHE